MKQQRKAVNYAIRVDNPSETDFTAIKPVLSKEGDRLTVDKSGDFFMVSSLLDLFCGCVVDFCRFPSFAVP